jgi:hypothetical protein
MITDKIATLAWQLGLERIALYLTRQQRVDAWDRCEKATSMPLKEWLELYGEEESCN